MENLPEYEERGDGDERVKDLLDQGIVISGIWMASSPLSSSRRSPVVGRYMPMDREYSPGGRVRVCVSSMNSFSIHRLVG